MTSTCMNSARLRRCTFSRLNINRKPCSRSVCKRRCKSRRGRSRWRCSSTRRRGWAAEEAARDDELVFVEFSEEEEEEGKRGRGGGRRGGGGWSTAKGPLLPFKVLQGHLLLARIEELPLPQPGVLVPVVQTGSYISRWLSKYINNYNRLPVQIAGSLENNAVASGNHVRGVVQEERGGHGRQPDNDFPQQPPRPAQAIRHFRGYPCQVSKNRAEKTLCILQVNAELSPKNRPHFLENSLQIR